MIAQPDAWYTVETDNQGHVTITANHNGVQNPVDPMRLTSAQTQASVAFNFQNRAGFSAILGSICARPQRGGGRNLMFSFDSAMTPPEPGYQTGLQYIHQIQYAKTVEVGGLSGFLDCIQVPLDLNGLGWAECPAGRFFDGLYRTGSRYAEGEGVQQITQGSCCKAAELPAEWGDCHEEDVFREASVMYECPATSAGRPTAVVALHRGAMHNTLDDWDKIRCCGFAQIDPLPVEPQATCEQEARGR
jgi:hypothetical protein